MKKFVVCSVSIGDGADFVPHCLGAFNTREEAEQYKREDMNNYLPEIEALDEEIVRDEFCIQTANGDYGCVWNVDEIEF